MGTYHWVTDGSSAAGAIPPQTVGPFSLIGPLNSIAKRFQVRGCSLVARTGSAFGDGFGPYTWTHDFDFNQGALPTRRIYHSVRGIPMTVAATGDFSLHSERYLASWWSGDEELGVNQRCSYGKSTLPTSPSITYTGGIFGGSGWGGDAVDAGGIWSIQVAALFYVP